MWVIKSGVVPLPLTMKLTKRDCINRFVENRKYKSWDEAKNEGNSCVKVYVAELD